MKFRDVQNSDIKRIAEHIGANYGYLLRIKYGGTTPGKGLAKRIEQAAQTLKIGFIPRWSLLYPDEYEHSEATA